MSRTYNHNELRIIDDNYNHLKIGDGGMDLFLMVKIKKKMFDPDASF